MLIPKYDIGETVYFIAATVNPEELELGNKIDAQKVSIVEGKIAAICIKADAIGYQLTNTIGGFILEPLLFASKERAKEALKSDTGYAVAVGGEIEDEDEDS